MKLTRPALRYYGGKFRLAPWIIGFFPEHECYVEPFGGAASVMLTKAPSTREVYNDADEDVVTFFRVLRERYAEFLRVIELTPFSRQEFRLAHEPCADDLERARRFYIRSWQGVGGGPRANNSTGWRFEKNAKRGKSTVQDWTNVGHLRLVCERLRQVQIECDDALSVIRRYDSPTTLFYCDPPYLGETRGMRWREKGYQHEMTESDHRQLAEVLCGIQGLAILSGYPSALYAELFPGWRMVTKRSRINSLHNSCAMKTEALYLSPRAAAGVKQAHFELPESESIHSDIQQHRGE